MTRAENDVILEARALLEEEHKALTSGNLIQIESLIRQKEDVFGRLAKLPDGPAASIEALRSHAVRNQELLDEAMRGIRAVHDRIQEIRKSRHQLDTYDKTGRRTTIRSATGTVERRA